MNEQPSVIEPEKQLYKPSSEIHQYEEASDSSNGSYIDAEIAPVQWSASEYIAHDKTSLWYFGLFGAGGLLVVTLYLITGDLLAGLVVLVASITLSIYAGRKPATKAYKIDEKGVQVEEKFYPYSTFKSFSVVEEGGVDSVWLKPLKRLSPMVVMYFPPEDENSIVGVLSEFLPHEQRELDMIDQLSKRMRF